MNTSLTAGNTVRSASASYLLGDEIGRGGFGVTVRARREEDGADVVIKFLRWDKLDDWKALELFQREAQVLQGLDHPGIPRYQDDFTLGPRDAPDGYALVQEYIPGRTLEQVRATGGLSEAEMVAWFVQILDVLHYIHRRQPPIIHRDIAPKNIIIEEGGRAHLIDFGAVQNRVRNADSALGTSVGTFGYAPTEQFMGRASPASDMYSLAVSYLAMATGRDPEDLPHDGANLDVRTALAPLRLDARLSLLLERMTEPDPTRRLGDAFEAVETARKVLRDLQPAAPVAVQPPAPAAPPRRSTARQPSPSTVSQPRAVEPGVAPSDRKRRPTRERRDRRPPPLQSSAQLHDAKARVDAIAQAGFWSLPDTGGRAELERAAISADGSHAALIAYWGCYVLRLRDFRLTPVVFDSIACRQGAWSSNGRHLAISDSYGGIVTLVTVAAGDEPPTVRKLEVAGLRDMDNDHRVAVSPDGEMFALSSDGIVIVHAWSTGDVVTTISRGDADPLGLFWTPGGETLVATDDHGSLFLDRDGRRSIRGPGVVDVSPDGRLLAIQQKDIPHGKIVVSVGAFGRLVPRIEWTPRHLEYAGPHWVGFPHVFSIRFSPDGRLLAVNVLAQTHHPEKRATDGCWVVVLEVATGQTLARIGQPLDRREFELVHDVGFSADSKRVLIKANAVSARSADEASDELFVFDIARRRYVGAVAFTAQGVPIGHTRHGFHAWLAGTEHAQAPDDDPMLRDGLVQQVLAGGRTARCLSATERHQLADLNARWAFCRHAAANKRLADDKGLAGLANLAAGLTHLLPYAVEQAGRDGAMPRFGQRAQQPAKVTATALTKAIDVLRSRSEAERAVLFEEFVRRVTAREEQQERDRVAAAARRAEEQRQAAAEREMAAAQKAEAAHQQDERLRVLEARAAERKRREHARRREEQRARHEKASHLLARALAAEQAEDSKWLFKKYDEALVLCKQAAALGADGAPEAVARIIAKMD